MASTKEIFSKGLNYILREIKDQKEMYETGLQYLKIVEQRITVNNRLNANKHISKIKTDLQVIKEQIRRSEKDFKYYVEHYGYTEDEINNRAKNQKYNIHPATDEELQADYDNDLKELEFDKVAKRGSYTEEDHKTLIDKVNNFNIVNELPLLSY